MTDSILFENFDIVHSYTREQALADGCLVDVTDFAREAGFKIPVAVTASVFDKYVDWNEEDDQRQTSQDVTGRLWDILCMMRFQKHGIEKNGLFKFLCIPRNKKSRRQSPIKVVLKALIHSGDIGEPVITVSLPDED